MSCASFCWGRVNFLPGFWYEAVFWISADKQCQYFKDDFVTAEQHLNSIKGFSASPTA